VNNPFSCENWTIFNSQKVKPITHPILKITLSVGADSILFRNYRELKSLSERHPCLCILWKEAARKKRTTFFMNRKTCIVAEGGGLRASYVVGVVKALTEKFHITSVDIAVATSGSAGTLAYYVARQFDSIINIWTNLLLTWKVLSLRNVLLGNPVLNIDYLIDVLFKQRDRLNVETLRFQPTELFIPVTNYQTGEAKYFSNHDDVDFSKF
jgi:predicted acylesterase/phospholipase RssA